MSNVNDDLLLCVGNPYPDATHWLTIGKRTYSNSDGSSGAYYGYYSGTCGSLVPDTIDGKIIKFLEDCVEGSAGFFQTVYNDDTYSPRIMVTNLLDGSSSYMPTNFKDQSQPRLGLISYEGQTIPLKIELV